MAAAASYLTSRGLRLNTATKYALLYGHPGSSPRHTIGVGRKGLWICTNHERLAGSYGNVTRSSAISQLRSGQRAANAKVLQSSAVKEIQSLNKHQCRCLSTQGKDDQQQAQKKLKPLASIIPRYENIYTFPNFLTVTRLACAPLIGYLLLNGSYPLALGLFVYAGVTDLVDGYIARRWNSQTVVGTILDPAADKALMTVVVGVLGWEGILPVPLAVLILGRDVVLSLTAFYYRYISLPPPRTMARYWDFSLPSAEVKPTQISKVNTFLQLGLIGATMTGLAFPEMMGETAQAGLEVSWWIVGGTTIWSGASYLGKGGVKILGKKP